jgi:hypothetical protein
VSNPHNYTGKVTLQRVRLNSQGYTSRGQYYGVGARLYWFCCDEPFYPEHREGFLRATSRTSAKAAVRTRPLMSECKFYN